MKQAYSLLVAMALLAPATALAQQPWQPFRPGLAQYTEAGTPGDSAHVLRLGAGVRVPGTTDTLYQFSQRVGRGNGSSAGCFAMYMARPDNLFGATLRSRTGGAYVLAAANGRTLELHPRAAVGQVWATGLPGITAQMLNRSLGAVGPTVMDSVATISLSDGQTLRISKHFGLVNGPSLDSYLNGRNSRRTLLLTALPTQALGALATGTATAFDFQPGDVFQYASTDNVNQAVCMEAWWQDSVLTRRTSPTSDTLIYTISRRQRTRGYGMTFPTTPPLPTCTSPTGTFFSGPTVLTMRYAANWLSPLTSAIVTGQLTQPASHTAARYNSRYETAQMAYLMPCSGAPADSVGFQPGYDGGQISYTATGLGTTSVRRANNIGASDYTMNLVYYRKGTETWGGSFPPRFFLAARDVRPAPSTTAFPNPFTSALTATFALARPQAVAAELRDALGRTVRQVLAASFAAGTGQLEVSTAGLPAGVYALHLRLLGEGRNEVLKVVHGE